jgi:hypothetical protein
VQTDMPENSAGAASSNASLGTNSGLLALA